MVPSKSQTQVYLDLFVELLRSNPLQFCNSKDVHRDVECLLARVAAEGFSFLTKTLPKLGKALDLGLEESLFSRPREFKSSRKNDCRPAFMQANFKRVFDENGAILDEADPAAVSYLRQVCFFGYKLELPYQETDEVRVIRDFVATEGELDLSPGVERDAIIAAAGYIARDVFKDFDPKDIVPRHGPGSVATGERLEEKWQFARLYDSIHQCYPYYDYFIVGGAREAEDRLGWYKSMQRLKTGEAKVLLVPKDSRGPRLISCEPLEFQWIQQGLGRRLVSHMESFRTTKGQINFTSQEVNRTLALESSKTKEFATLDLKEASDRVSVALVERLFQHNPLLLRCLLACRTTATTLPDGRVLPLKKFAPMGSALCFPVLAFTAWSVTVAALARAHGASPASVGKSVFVYGDDIVVPTKDADTCIAALELVGLRVNRTKSCIKGFFRESCGMDAFKGVPVTPTRLKTLWTGKPSDGACYASWIGVANNLAEKGYVSVAEKMFEHLERVYGTIPYALPDSGYPGRRVRSYCEAILLNSGRVRMRVHKDYQRVQIQAKFLKARKVASTLDGWTRLLRDNVMGAGDDPSEVVVPRSTLIKRGWKFV